MNLPYVQATTWDHNHVKRESVFPWIRFGIYNPTNPTNIVYPLGLIDSGSEITFITHEFGKQLGYNIKDTKMKGHVDGVGGGSIEVFYHKVGLILDDGKEKFEFVDYIGFSYSDFPTSMPQQTAILGTVGFFNHLNLSLKYPTLITIDQNS